MLSFHWKNDQKSICIHRLEFFNSIKFSLTNKNKQNLPPMSIILPILCFSTGPTPMEKIDDAWTTFGLPRSPLPLPLPSPRPLPLPPSCLLLSSDFWQTMNVRKTLFHQINNICIISTIIACSSTCSETCTSSWQVQLHMEERSEKTSQWEYDLLKTTCTCSYTQHQLSLNLPLVFEQTHLFV